MIRGTAGFVADMGDIFTVGTGVGVGDKLRSIARLGGAGGAGAGAGAEAEVGAEQPELWQEPCLPGRQSVTIWQSIIANMEPTMYKTHTLI